MSDVPERTGKTIFVVGSAIPKWVLFECPCTKGHRLSVPLMTTVSPNWQLSLNNNTVSLWPSVVVADSDLCASHFWLRDNRIEWALWDDERADPE